jgi:hypothetical protein
MKKALALLLLLLSIVLFAACEEEAATDETAEEEPTDTESLEGTNGAQNVMWKMTSSATDSSPSTQYWQYKDGKLNTYYENTGGKYYYPADETSYVIDETNKTLTYSGYTYSYTLTNNETEFRLTYNTWWAAFVKSTADPATFEARAGNARRFENPFVEYLYQSGELLE